MKMSTWCFSVENNPILNLKHLPVIFFRCHGTIINLTTNAAIMAGTNVRINVPYRGILLKCSTGREKQILSIIINEPSRGKTNNVVSD